MTKSHSQEAVLAKAGRKTGGANSSGGTRGLADFDRVEGNGDWTVQICDNAGADTGTVNNICLIFDPTFPVEMTSFTS